MDEKRFLRDLWGRSAGSVNNGPYLCFHIYNIKECKREATPGKNAIEFEDYQKKLCFDCASQCCNNPANAIWHQPMHAVRQSQNAHSYAPHATASLFSFAFNPDKSACAECQHRVLANAEEKNHSPRPFVSPTRSPALRFFLSPLHHHRTQQLPRHLS